MQTTPSPNWPRWSQENKRWRTLLISSLLDRYLIQDGELRIGAGPAGTAERFWQSREDLGRLQRRVRDITDRDLRSLVALLPPALAARLEYEATEYAVRTIGGRADRIRRETHASDALLEKVRDLPGLDEERSEAIEQLAHQLVTQRTRENERVLGADTSVRDAAYRRQDVSNKSALRDQMNSELHGREDIEAEWRSSLRALLTEDERAVIDEVELLAEAIGGE